MKKFFLAFAVLVATLCCQQLAAQTQINQANIHSFPYYITQPGSYILTSNLTVSSANTDGIMIYASGVTLNLNGYSITGPTVCTSSSCTNSNGYVGIWAFDNNTTIMNGTVSGFTYGVLTNSGSVHDLNVSSAVDGIEGNQTIITHNSVQNGTGVGIFNESGTVADNVISGFYFGIQSFSSTDTNNAISNCTGWGIYLEGGFVTGNTFNGNTGDIAFLGNYVTSHLNVCSSGAC